MMMRDVPLDAAGHPGADEADERRFDDVLAVDEVVVVGLVDAFENAAADLGQDADAEVLVLQVDDGVSLVDFLARQRIVHRIGIDRPLRALGLAAEEERGFFLGGPRQVRGGGGFCFQTLPRKNQGEKGRAREKKILKRKKRKRFFSRVRGESPFGNLILCRT